MVELAGASESAVALGIVEFVVPLLFLDIDWFRLDMALSVSIRRCGGCSRRRRGHGGHDISRVSVDDVASRWINDEVSVLRLSLRFRVCGCGGDI